VFTGIIEHLGTIKTLSLDEHGGRITIQAPSLAAALAVSGSIAVNGCCLTIVACDKNNFSADLSPETLNKTTFSSLNEGDRVNLEQPLTAGKEFGGHFVLGHIDGTGAVVAMDPEGDSWRYSVQVPPELARYVVPKGSITIDGISLTVANWENQIAEIAVIPFTYANTNIRDRDPGDVVNLESDVLGKYIEQHLEARANRAAKAPISLQDLVSQGF